MLIITIDGLSGCGKSTVAKRIAAEYQLPQLDSGAIYRTLALQLTKNTKQSLKDLLADFNSGCLEFTACSKILYNGVNISQEIRTIEIAETASKLAKKESVRAALLQVQRQQLTDKGLVADGRDMGTTVFTQATIKFFLTAELKARASRRHKELRSTNKNVSISSLIESIELRDKRDASRNHSPVEPALDAIIVDTSNMTLDEVVTFCKKKIDSIIK